LIERTETADEAIKPFAISGNPFPFSHLRTGIQGREGPVFLFAELKAGNQ
jgi:hypothetical protein